MVRTTWRLLGFLRPFWAEVVLSIFLGAGTVAAAVGLLGTSAYLIASAALKPSIAALQVAIVGVRFFGIARGGLRYLERLVSHSVNLRLLAGLRSWFYKAVEPLVPGGLEDVRGGDLLNRAMGDVEALEAFYVRAVAPPVSALIVAVGVSLFVGQYEAILGWALAAGMGVGGGLVPALVRRLAAREGRTSARARAQLSADWVDSIQGLADLIANGQAVAMGERVTSAGRLYERAQCNTARLGALGTALVGLAGNLSMAGVLVLAIPLANAGALNGVMLAVLALVTLAAFEAVTPLTQAAQQLESGIQAAKRLFEVADQKPNVDSPITPAPAPRSADILARGLTFRYGPGKETVLDGLDLDFPYGKRMAVVGPSGAGKSTLAGVLARLYDCPAGSVWLAGRDIRDYDPDEVRRWIAYEPQPCYLFSGTLRENLLLANPEVGETELGEALRVTGLETLVQRLQQGLDGRVGSQGEQLSGGERQRVAVARALLSKAKTLILDEPTSGLDASSAAMMLQAVEQATRGRSLLVITHRLNGLDWMDEILVLNKGCVVEQGTQAELLARNGWFSQALALQKRLLEPEEL